MRRRTLLVLVSAGLVLAAGTLPSASAQRGGGTTTGNLIRNPGAESGKGARNATTVIRRLPGWHKLNPEVTAVRYGASGGFPGKNTPGPSDRGKNFFAGGPGDAMGVIDQIIDVGTYRRTIDGGHVHYTAGAWLGGFKGQADSATVVVSFQNGNGVIIRAVTLGPVDTNLKTKFVHTTKSGRVPERTRAISVQPQFTRVSGDYNDAYVDSMSLKLSGV